MYKILGFRTGECTLPGRHVFKDHDPDGEYKFYMYVWVLLGGERPILIDTGPKSIEKIREGIRGLTIEPVWQREGEDIHSILRRAHVKAEDVGYVIFTHLHYDHCSNADLFPNAKLVTSRKGFEEALQRPAPWVPGEVFFPMQREWRDRVVLVDEGEIEKGIEIFWIGGHTPCSIAIAVETPMGRVVFGGDTVSLYENIEKDIPVGIAENYDECLAAYRRIRQEADIVIPGHDPKVMERFGVVLLG